MKGIASRAKPKSLERSAIEIQLPHDPLHHVMNIAVALIVGQFFWQHSGGDWMTSLFTTILTLFTKEVR